MKKILSLLIGTVALTTVSFAQNCTIDNSITSIGVYPTVAQGFNDGFVNTPYEQVAQIKVILDTIVDFAGTPTSARVLYAVVDSVKGMPDGFTYACNPSNCEIPGGDIGCTVMSGTPSLADVNKTFDLTIYTTLYGLPIDWLGMGIAPLPFPVEFTDYSVTIQPEANSTYDVNPAISSNVYPNPASENVTVEMNANSSEDVTVSINNILGATVKSKNIKLNSGLNTLSFATSDMNTGLYLVSIEGSFGRVIHKLMVK